MNVTSSPPKVSVLMTTYNHERYVKQAIQSVLMQKTKFEYELVIGEDCSTDRTREIIIDLQRRYPDRIMLFPRERNLGGNENFILALQACRGQYVAILEGDDYWTSADKLQRQVDFLDAHPDFSICFHAVRRISEDPNIQARVYRSPRKRVFTLEDILLTNFIPTCSVMFRNGLITEIPDWLPSLKATDWAWHILNARHGKVGLINESMGVYRLHAAGATRSMKYMEWIPEYIKILELVNAELGFRYDKTVRSALCAWYFRLALHLAIRRNLTGAMKCAREGIVEYCRSKRFPTGAVRYFITEYKVGEWLKWRD
jgi:glycosyltransferase involved in cell wall biosynthesis